MPYYRFDNGLQPLSAPPEAWQGVLAVLEPSELHSAPLPSWLTPPAAPADPHESQFCWLRIDRDGVTGHLRTPVRASQSARSRSGYCSSNLRRRRRDVRRRDHRIRHGGGYLSG